MADDDDYEVGYGRPPRSTQFPPGVSGNKGRRSKHMAPLPYNEVLGRKLWITTDDGERRQVAAEEAFLMRLLVNAHKKGGLLRRYAHRAIERAERQEIRRVWRVIVHAVYAQPGEVAKPMEKFGMTRLLDRTGAAAKWVIEPWLVQEALDRLGERRLTVAEQEAVVVATRKPHSVKWPEWWSVSSRFRRSR